MRWLTAVVVLGIYVDIVHSLIGLRSPNSHSFRKAPTYHHPNVASRKPDSNTPPPSVLASRENTTKNHIQRNTILRTKIYDDIDQFFFRTHKHKQGNKTAIEQSNEPKSDNRKSHLIDDTQSFEDYTTKRRCHLVKVQGCGVRLLRKTFKRRKNVCEYFEKFTKCIIDRVRGCGRRELERSISLLNKAHMNLTLSGVCENEDMQPIRLSTHLRRINHRETSKCRPQALVRCTMDAFLTSIKKKNVCTMIQRYENCIQKAVEPCSGSPLAKIKSSVISIRKACKRARS
ncbi:hypothetical protein ScPMuIL_001106 [Solemya velum]